MSAARVEEFDVLAPRLAKAVLTRRDARTTAQVDQVTEREGRDWRKRDGELLVGASIPVGISAARRGGGVCGIGGLLSYEMERARLDAAFLGQFNSSGDELWHGGLTLGAAYLFNAGNTSPYVGASLGYGATWMGSDVDDADFGLLTSVGGGVEFFRLCARMLIDAQGDGPHVSAGPSLPDLHRDVRRHTGAAKVGSNCSWRSGVLALRTRFPKPSRRSALVRYGL